MALKTSPMNIARLQKHKPDANSKKIEQLEVVREVVADTSCERIFLDPVAQQPDTALIG